MIIAFKYLMMSHSSAWLDLDSRCTECHHHALTIITFIATKQRDIEDHRFKKAINWWARF